MRALIQRVKQAKVEISGKIVGEIGKGLLILLGVAHADTENDISFLIEKISNLRIFEDSEGKMNLSLLDVKGEALVVSQFTLYADCRKGRRPSFTDAALPEQANTLYKKFVQKFKETGLKIEQGEFGAMMDVSLVNSGPVTIMIES
jgi:D-tyrosyl-tRNA(Tyr) deacylase